MAIFEPVLELELDEGEYLIRLTRRHWVVIFQEGFIPLLLGLLTGGLAMYRAIGGQFIEDSVGRYGQVDFINLLVLTLIGIVILLWGVSRRGDPKQRSRSWPYVLTVGLLSLCFFFRYRGGRVFYVDPFNTPGIDTLNGILLVISILSLILFVYMVIDWSNDFLILTNMRVIVDDTQFLVRHVQQQMLIADIQQVNLRSDSYLEYWLSLKNRPAYGTLIMGSFSPRRLVFDRASNPKAMQDAIMKEVNGIRRQEEPERLRGLIEDQVYGNKPPKKPGLAIQVQEKRGPIPRLFEPNPRIDYEREIITWRPFWLFLVFAWLQPITLIVGTGVVLYLLRVYELLTLGVATLVWLPFLLIGAGWIFWVYEDYRNDVYILTRQNITDVDKRPFGPEKRRVAPLGAIQDISFDIGYFEIVLEYLFGIIYGNVIIETGGSGGGRFTFEHVPDPRGVQATINDYLTDFRKREKERSLSDSLALLKQYHEAQRTHNEVIDWDKLLARVAADLPNQMDGEWDRRVSEALASQMPGAVQRAARTTARNEVLRALRRVNARRNGNGSGGT